jgi:hypothetical protein
MKRAWIAAVLLIAGCGKKAEPDQCCQILIPPKQRNITRPAGIVLTGLPDSPELAAVDERGRWGVKTATIEHSIVDPKEKGPLLPKDGKPTLSLYRDSLPFPQFNWKSGAWEVTQLVYPYGKGFVARYHVMNHGDQAGSGQLKVVATEDSKIAAADKAAASSLVFDLKIEPGISAFINVTTADLEGKIPDDALDQATAKWEKLIGDRALKVPDAAVMTNYFADVAGAQLGVSGCAEAAAKTEAMLVRKEGNALRLLAGIPESWQLEAIEARELMTEFGAVTFRYQGVYNNRTFEIKGCKPADGFLISVPKDLVARIDGKDAPVKDGVVRVPAGASFVEVMNPR